MLGQEEDAAIHADAYIDALLARPRLAEMQFRDDVPADPVRRAADLLAALPRFHPSFAFEDALAARLRRLAEPSTVAAGRLAEIIAFPGRSGDSRVGTAWGTGLPPIDRRLIVGGAIASGVSVAALYAWWQAARRPRPEVVA